MIVLYYLFSCFAWGEIPSDGSETLMSVELGMGYFQRSNFFADLA
jgi:hypothetical protein